jgi:hypothetical protein
MRWQDFLPSGALSGVSSALGCFLVSVAVVMTPPKNSKSDMFAMHVSARMSEPMSCGAAGLATKKVPFFNRNCTVNVHCQRAVDNLGKITTFFCTFFRT